MNKPLLKVLVFTFSFSVGAFLVWQLKGNLEGESQVSSEQGEVEERQEAEVEAFAVSPKSAGGSLRFFEEESEKENDQPLLPGSKSGIFIPLSPVDPAWEEMVPVIPAEPNSEE